jgi:tRNA-2-methylthio-N6-dimethylallyladenosine synthase
LIKKDNIKESGISGNIDLTQLEQLTEPSKEPLTEPDRQYYFMEKTKELIAKTAQKSGKPLTFSVCNFGCQMNAKDSERLAGILKAMGYEEAEDEFGASFVIYNTCTVRENANDRIYGRLGQMKPVKKANPNKIIAISGCMTQDANVLKILQKSYGFLDIIMGTHNNHKLAELLYTRLITNAPVVDIWQEGEDIVEDLPAQRNYSYKAGVNIMFGCNNFCSYCIVPYVRGRERSRNSQDILREIKELADDGVVDITLLGQNVNSYGKRTQGHLTFEQLLVEVEKIDGIKRIRFMTSHPKDLSDELIKVMKNSKKICKHLHLPVQAGSSRILELMNRYYSKEDYLTLVDKIREAVPDISITTDIIVGFPEETEEDFQETLDLIRKVAFDSAFTFLFSVRNGTPAATMEDQVPEDVAKERFNRLLKEIQEISRNVAGKLTGTTEEVLVENINEQDESWVTGRMSNNTLVHFPGGEELIGKLVNVKLVESKGFYYLGERT